ncbi:MAG: DNA polymerase/3'-5' exonuclease PolX [Phycisphaerales bacterium]|jgi:DNA polymerase (family 10)|nr:DNA polymerase/3'-5' exonuclease PolX [Phycisphaerales bacterium]
MSTNSTLAALFHQFATILEISGANAFRINAHTKVARVLEDLVDDISTIDDPASLQGIGKGSASKIEEFLETGEIHELTELLESIPSGLLDVMKVQGLGPKTVRRLWQEADVTDLQSLKEAITEGRLVSLPRMGKKTIANIADSLEFLETSSIRTRLGVAMPIAEEIVDTLSKLDGILQIQFVGSLRRGKETIGDIDILASTTNPTLLTTTFCSLKGITKILVQGETKCSVRLDCGMQVDLRVVEEDVFGATLMYFTGSKEHNVLLREHAKKQGKRLNEYGLFDQNEACLASKTESDIYQNLGYPYIPPEVREGKSECLLQTTPNLIEHSDIQSDLHCHTLASDGHLSIVDLAREARHRGFHTVAVTDHSKSSVQANGLSQDRLLKHIREIQAANEEIDGITILAGSEVDIHIDGTLDYADDMLEQLDIVVASPHASLKQDPSKATARLLAAIEHPLVHIIGHPTGRVLGKRPGLELDMSVLFAAAAETQTALEINANSWRLDLRDTHVQGAIEAGVMISINTDAHSAEDFDQLRYGILTARRGWVTPDKCINCFSPSQLKTWLARKC